MLLTTYKKANGTLAICFSFIDSVERFETLVNPSIEQNKKYRPPTIIT